MVLIASGTNLNYHESREHKTALHIAACNNHIKVMALLLKRFVDDIDKYHRTALHYSSIFGSVDSISLLLKYKANIFKRDQFNKTPMMIAKENGNNDIYNFLKRYNDRFHHNNNNKMDNLF